MASYRFCRSDDIPLLVDAYNACFRPPGKVDPIDRDRFKWWIRVLELWTSSCMVATEGGQLIGVVLAAKLRARLGVPGIQRALVGVETGVLR